MTRTISPADDDGEESRDPRSITDNEVDLRDKTNSIYSLLPDHEKLETTNTFEVNELGDYWVVRP